LGIMRGYNYMLCVWTLLWTYLG